MWLHNLSDILIWTAYLAIPIILVHFIRKRRNVPFKSMFVMFGIFILSCGLTHFIGAVTSWVPVYRIDGLLKLATAAASWATVIALIPMAPKALAMRMPEELEREIEQRKKAQAELIQNERIKDEFVANVSHELRTPLTLILAPIESMLAGSKPDVEQLHVVHRNGVRLLQLVNGLLDFSKLEAGKIQVRRQPVDAAALTRAISFDFGLAFKNRALDFTVETSMASMPVLLDGYLFERIVFNLLSNALKFTERGGVSIHLTRNDDRLVLSVSDTGIGISEEDQKNLFQKFRQLEGSATRRFEGTGLGLALVKEFAELLGGSVSVRSAPGQGSTFTVDLQATPCALNEDSKQERTTRAPAPENGGEPWQPAADETGPRILIAEDNVELARFIGLSLKGMGQIRSASNGKEALELVSSWKPELILSDIMMPELDGLSLCKAVKADSESALIPFVLLTALTDRQALLKGWEAGADEYLFKPFHPEELKARVRNLLHAARQRRDLIEAESKREAAEAARRQALFLAEAHAAFDSSIEFEATLTGIVRAIVPSIADGCLVEIREEETSTIRTAVGYVMNGSSARAEHYTTERPYDGDREIPDRPALINTAILEKLPPIGAQEESLLRIQPRSAMTLPIKARRKCLGTLTLLAGPNRKPYAPDDVSLAEDLAGRAGLSIDNARLYRQAQEALRLREEFLSIAAHELRTPLTSLRLNTQTLARSLRQAPSDSPIPRDKVMSSVETLDRTGLRMEQLVENLLDISRIRSGRLKLAPEELDLRELVSTTVDRFGPELARAGSTVSVEGPGPLKGQWDRLRLEQVLSNLLSNAVKYGGGKPIAIRISADDESAKVAIEDHGIGIDPDALKRLFQPFERAVSTRHYGGLGMGLYIVRQVVEAHGGLVQVSSQVGQGSTFVIKLPRRATEKKEPVDA